MLRPWTATIPTARPISRLFHGAGKARIAATRTIVASTPLQPDSIDTAKPFALLCSTLPVATTPGSNSVTSPALAAAIVLVHGTTKCSWTQGVSSAPKSTACSTRKVTKKRITRRFYGSSRHGHPPLVRRGRAQSGGLPYAPQTSRVRERSPAAPATVDRCPKPRRIRDAVQQLRVPALVPAGDARRLFPAWPAT